MKSILYDGKIFHRQFKFHGFLGSIPKFFKYSIHQSAYFCSSLTAEKKTATFITIQIAANGEKQAIRITGFICVSCRKVPSVPTHTYEQPTFQG